MEENWLNVWKLGAEWAGRKKLRPDQLDPLRDRVLNQPLDWGFPLEVVPLSWGQRFIAIIYDLQTPGRAHLLSDACRRFIDEAGMYNEDFEEERFMKVFADGVLGIDRSTAG